MTRLKGKVALITGGAGFLGERFSEFLAQEQATVVMGDVSVKAGEQKARRLKRKWGGRVHFVKLDVSDESNAQEAVAGVVKRFKRLDILVNNAIGVGRSHFAPVEGYSLADWDHVMAVTVRGSFVMAREAAQVMKKQKSGSIINMGSIYGVVGADQRIYGKSGLNSPAVYAASKGAVLQLTRYLSVYWAPRGIRVNAISPGGVENSQSPAFVRRYSARTPLGTMLKPGDLRGALVYLASDESRMVTGHNLMVDGGWTAW